MVTETLNVDHFLITTYENQLLFIIIDESERGKCSREPGHK